MAANKLDAKNVELVKMLSALRDHIDIHRIIGLNNHRLKNSKISSALLGYMQKAAHESLAIYLCKIYESQGRNDLNSIPGILDATRDFKFEGPKISHIREFWKTYGNVAQLTNPHSHLTGTFHLFVSLHSESLRNLKIFRDAIGAHSDSKTSIKSLPSHAVFEDLYKFSLEFYSLVARAVGDSVPAILSAAAGRGLLKLFGQAGVPELQYQFENEQGHVA